MGETVKITSMDVVSLEVLKVEDASIQVHYHTLEGHNPNKCGDYFGLWRYTAGQAIAGCARWSQIVELETTDDICWLDADIDSNAYAVGYSQAGDPKQNAAAAGNLSACDLVAASYDAGSAMPQKLSFSMEGDTRSVTFRYHLLPGACPAESWIGIWNLRSDFRKEEPMRAFRIDPVKDKLHLDNIGFARGGAYQIVYFADGFAEKKKTNEMAQVCFQFVEG